MTALPAPSWNRRVWVLAGPIILSNLTVPLLGAVDTAVVGHLPDPRYIGGVAVGALVFSFVYWGFGFLRMGTTGLTAQAWGAGDTAEIRAALGRALLLALALGVALVVLQGPIGRLAFWMLHASPGVEAEGSAYYAMRIWGAPAALANYALLGWFLGLQNARWPLVLQVFTNSVNIVLDLVFVMGLGWGVVGVAGATVIAEYAGLALGLWLAVRRLGLLPAGTGRARLIDGASIRRLVAVNGDIFIRTLCLIFAWAWFTAQGATLGDVTLAANAILMILVTFAAYGLDGFAHAAEALVGGMVGRGDRAGFSGAVRAAMRLAAVLSGGVALVYALAGPLLIDVLTGLPEVRAAAREYLPWAAAAPVVAVWCYTFDGIFIGATRTAELRNAMILSMAGYLAAAHWLLLPAFGNHGLWAALMLFFVLRGITLAAYYPALARELSG